MNRLRNLGGWRFSNVTAEAGVACADPFSTGAAFADIDGDGDLDLLVNGLGVGTRVFRNDGTGRFTEDHATGLDRRSAATSLALADADGDGDLDLYVATYRVISARSEVPAPKISVRRVQDQFVIYPANRFRGFPLSDGQVELAEKGEADAFYLNDGQGRFQRVAWTGGTFLDETGQPLAEPPEDWSLSVLFRDLTGDGQPDLYVCNDFFRSRDQFWIQDGPGRFRAAPALAWRNMSLSSMAADAADLDRDGHDDLFVVEMLSRDHGTRHRQRANAFRPEQAIPFSDPHYRPELPRNTLFHARGDGSFAEIAQFAGLAATDWTWNVAFLDIDLDGFEDVLVATGNPHDVLDLDAQNALDRSTMRGTVPALSFYPPLPQRPLAFRNQGDLTFTNMSEAWSLPSPGFAHGLALADLDNDGDLDVVMNRLHQPALLLRNDSTAPRIAVRLRGQPPNTRGVGAKVRLLGGPVPQSQEIMAGGRYLSADDTARTFAAPSNATPFTIEVLWRSGRRSLLTNATPNRIYEVEEPSAMVNRRSASIAAGIPPAIDPGVPAGSSASQGSIPVNPLFTDVSPLLGHKHRDPSPPDFTRQPLLPRALNHPGPGIAWMDRDQDGWDDLVLPSGSGRSPEVFRNERGLRFSLHLPPSPHPSRSPDPLGILPWPRGTNRPLLLATFDIHTHNDTETPDPRARSAVQILDPSDFRTLSTLPGAHSNQGTLAIADVDADGDLDVFVGGREVPGRFPEAATSQLFLNKGGQLQADPSQDETLRRAGLIRGAVFADLDRDGAPDLALACEWGPIRVLLNRKGRLVEARDARRSDHERPRCRSPNLRTPNLPQPHDPFRIPSTACACPIRPGLRNRRRRFQR